MSSVANPVLTADRLHAPVSCEGRDDVGSELGSAGVVVYDDSHHMVDAVYQVSRVLHVEGCGQCNYCKSGALDVTSLLGGLVLGTSITTDVVAHLRRALAGVSSSARCRLPTQEQCLVASLVDGFPDDPAERLAGIPGKHPDRTLRDTPVRLTSR